jgi:hypothetical protein
MASTTAETWQPATTLDELNIVCDLGSRTGGQLPGRRAAIVVPELAGRVRSRPLEPTGPTVRPPRTRLVHWLPLIMKQGTVGVCAVVNSCGPCSRRPSQVTFGVSNRTVPFA